MKKIFPFILVFLLGTLSGLAQDKKALSHEDYAIWNQIDRELISNNGDWVAYVVEPGEGNPELRLYSAAAEETRSFPRGDRPQFSENSKFVVFNLKPDYHQLRELRRSGTKKEDLPQDTLAVYNLNTGALRKIPQATDWQLPRFWNDWLVYKQTTEMPAEGDKKATERTDLVIHHLESDTTYTLAGVVDFTVAKKAPQVLASADGKAPESTAGVFRFDGDRQTWIAVHEQEGRYEQLALSEDGAQAAFLANFDTTGKARIDQFALYIHNDEQNLRMVADSSSRFLPEDWRLSEHGDLTFSRNGRRLFFGIAPNPILPDTTLLPEEKVSVEVWSYQDKMLYTMQEVRAEREKKRTYSCVYHLDNGKILQLGSEALPTVRLGDEGNADYVLAYTEQPYLERYSWEGFPSYKDVYLINVETGEQKQIAEELRGNPALSPNGKYVYWYNSLDTAWYAYATYNDKQVRLTNNEQVPFFDELNDRPDYPRAYGIAGWTRDDDFVLIYDRYDVWLVDPSKNLAHNNLTNGRKQKRRSRLVWLDRDERTIDEVEPMLMHFQDEESLQEGYYWFNIHTGTKNTVLAGDYSYTSRPLKAKKANHWLFTRESYQEFPDLHYARGGLGQATKISEVNPQQSEYKWGTIEHYEWTSTTGEKLRGLLVKPEGFDPTKKYPMIVNFYERSSDRLHRHRTPTPGRSTINYPFYASRGYLIFNPDVPYQIGYPGESAYNAVLSGVTSLIDEGFVDRENIGLQGHSWGGYQIAHILTKTDLFKCAESGAPVVNMISAYGGIRWGSGMSRMFQYEHTQSRIGGTIWEKPLRYIENSPIFFVDKINTPVLILHNDEDGAVPWYQGIEFFVAMRRLGKPAWMLNYNGEPHWPVKLQNRKDFQLRMSQFFDHYLQGAPMPRWMAEGVPAIEKGIDQRLELLERH